MATDDWAAQARFWAKEYRRRALAGAVDILPQRTRVEVLQHLERIDAPGELDFAMPNPYSAACLVSSRVVLPPASLVIPADAVYTREEGHHWSDVSVHQFRDVVLDQVTGLVFHQDRVLTASGHGWRSARDGAFLSGAYARVLDAPGIDARGPIAPMPTVFNFGHFLLEAVPRLLHIAEVEPTALPVFPDPMPDYAKGILADLGIRFDVARSAVALRSDNVWLCDPSPTGWPHPDDMQLLHDVVLDRLAISPDGYPDKLFVSRQGLPRSPLDEHLLEDHLAGEGFTVIYPQKLSFREQVAHFRAASVVVGDFGAGHTNMVFMEPGTQLVDVTTGEWWTPHFRNIAAMRGMRYDLAVLPATAENPFGRAIDAIPIVSQAVGVGA